MAKFKLSTKVKLEVETPNGKDLVYNVTYREIPTKKQRELTKPHKEVLDLFQKRSSLEERISVLNSKMVAHEELGEFGELKNIANKLDKLYDKRDEIEELFTSSNGEDKIFNMQKEKFDYAVGGKDKEALAAWIEEEGQDYQMIMDVLKEDAENQKGN